MPGLDNAYSRIVAAAKIILPLIALGLLSTLFLFSRSGQQGEPSLPYADLTVLDLAREQRLGAPTFSGVTAQGTRVSLAAERLFPDDGNREIIHGVNMVARLISPDGLIYDISADTGQIDQPERQTTFAQNVRILTSSGYDMRTDEAVMNTDMTRVESPGPVRVTGPLGELDAGNMVYTGDPAQGTEARVVFKGGVRLLYNTENGSENLE